MRLLNIQEVQDMLLVLMKKLHVFLTEKRIPYYMLGGSALGAVRHNGFIPWDDDIDIGLFREDYDRFLRVCHEFDSSYEIVNFKTKKNCDFLLTRIYFPNTFIDNPIISKSKLDKRLYFDIFPLDNIPENFEEQSKFDKKICYLKKTVSLIDLKIYNNKSYFKFIGRKVFSIVLRPFRSVILKRGEKLFRKYQNQETSMICSLCSQYSFQKQAMLKSVYGEPKLLPFENAEFFVPEKFEEYLTQLFGANYMDIPPVEARRKGFDIYLLEGVDDVNVVKNIKK